MQSGDFLITQGAGKNSETAEESGKGIAHGGCRIEARMAEAISLLSGRRSLRLKFASCEDDGPSQVSNRPRAAALKPYAIQQKQLAAEKPGMRIEVLMS